MKKPTTRDLSSNEDGAVFIIGLFAAMILCGCLFYVMGVMEAVQHRESLQDKADGAAYSASSMQAKAMNLTSLTNIAKFSSASILTTYSSIYHTISQVPLDVDLTDPTLNNNRDNYILEADAIIESASLTQAALANVLESAELSTQSLFANSKVFTEHPIRQLPLAPSPAATIAQQCSPIPSALPGPPSLYDRAFAMVENYFQSPPIGVTIPTANLGTILTAIEQNTEDMCNARISLHSINFQEIDWDNIALNDFATRFYASSDTVPDEAESGMRIVLQDPPENNELVNRIRDHAGTIAWAQSYFYVDLGQPKETAMWRMDWKASLGRFSSPNRPALQNGCERVNGNKCGSVASMIESLEKASTH